MGAISLQDPAVLALRVVLVALLGGSLFALGFVLRMLLAQAVARDVEATKLPAELEEVI